MNTILEDIQINSNIFISTDVYKDTGIDLWSSNLPSLNGSKIIIDYIIKNPINDIELLKKRQHSFKFCPTYINFETLKDYENNIYSLYELEKEINNNEFMKLLFIDYFLINKINETPYFLDCFHFYKIVILPLMSLSYPLTCFTAPYYFLNKYLKIDFKDYIKYFISLIKIYFSFTNDFKLNMIRLITILLYISIYFYNIYQTFEYSFSLYKTRNDLLNKLNDAMYFMNDAIDIINNVNEEVWKPYYIFKNKNENENIVENYNLLIKNDITYVYKLWKDKSLLNKISNILKILYTIDIVYHINIFRKDRCCFVSYNTKCSKIWEMNNPSLTKKQISNPISLEKNLIITGPNACGKTTYIKSFLSNVILSQTFGISYSKKAELLIYDCIMSFMRVNDIVGSRSYFETETEYCSKMIKSAREINNNNKKGLFIMDEPMHSTPPIEGMSTAYAVIEYMGNLKNISILITTHYHKLADLEKEYSNKFINISFDAIVKKEGGFIFPYKINKGFSNQCIALELLEKQKLPEEVINNAIKIKNIICDKK